MISNNTISIGADIGGSKIHIVALRGERIERRKRKILRTQNKELFSEDIVSAIEEMINELGRSKVRQIGVGVAGPLSEDRETLLNPPNLPLKNFPLRKYLEDQLRVKVVLENDANCFAWGEYNLGAGREALSMIGITLGTGLGGGIVLEIEGKSVLWSGFHGAAGEVGWMVLDRGSALEELASAKGIRRFSKDTPQEVAREARRGNKKAREAFKSLGWWLGVGIANLVNIFDPEMIVIGGSISRTWPLFIQDTRLAAKKIIIAPSAKKIKIKKAKLGDDAGAIGAALLL